MKVYILGAGASAGTLGTAVCPVAWGFGEAISGELSRLPADCGRVLGEVADHLGRPLQDLGLEAIWSCIDYHSKFKAAVPEPEPWDEPTGIGSVAIKQAILQLYGRRCDERAESLPLEGTPTLWDIVGGLQPGDLLVSFNYDTIVERLAKRRGLPLRMVRSDPEAQFVWLAKPHGSTSWPRDFRSNRVLSEEDDGSPRLESLGVGGAEMYTREPLLLGAVPIKSELIAEVQEAGRCSEVHAVIARQWKELIIGLSRAEQLTVLGYSFPKEDHHGRFLFQEAIRLRKESPPAGGQTLPIAFYELECAKGKTAAAICEVFGSVPIVLTPKGPVK